MELTPIQKEETAQISATTNQNTNQNQQITITDLENSHIKQIKEMLSCLELNKVFTSDDLILALETIEEKISNSWNYLFKVAEANSIVLGFACYEKVPASNRSYQIHWLAVHPDFQNKGVGKMLLEEAEKDIKSRGGKMIILETSTKSQYSGARHLYEKAGYKITAKVDKLYAEEEDYLMYKKDLAK